jgi:adenylate cyclase
MVDLRKALERGQVTARLVELSLELGQKVRKRYRELTLFMAVVLASFTAIVSSGQAPLIDGTLYDLASFVYSIPFTPRDSLEPVVLVSLDRESLASERLKSLSRTYFGNWLGEMTEALIAADARIVGFDILFGYAPPPNTDFDRNLKTAIRNNRSRVVSIRTLRTKPADEWIGAFYDPGRDAAAGREEPSAIAYADLLDDADGVVRRFQPSIAAVSDSPQSAAMSLPTFAGELLSRLGKPMKNEFLLRPEGPLEGIPSYRFIDVINCAEQDPEKVREAFAGKVVIIGTNLPSEDRVRGPDRFFAPPAEAPPRSTGECHLKPLGSSDPKSGTIPGMYLHAAAVRAVLRGEEVQLAPASAGVSAAGFAGSLGAGAGLLLAPWWALAAVALSAGLFFAMSSGLLAAGIWLPPAVPVGCLLVAMAGAYLIRFLVEERGRRRIQHAFSHYLAPAIVERLSEEDEELRLGGESREISVMFADLSGFTAMSERVGPEALVETTNRYLALIVAAVEETGGYVDKFLGDAVMALVGRAGGRQSAIRQRSPGRAPCCCKRRCGSFGGRGARKDRLLGKSWH